MKNNTKLGAVLAVLGVLTGLVILYLMAAQYNLVIYAKTAAGRTDEATSVTITYAVLGWIGIAAGAIWAAVLDGFVRKEKWAWFWGTVAATIQLLVGFFPAVPAMDSNLPAPTLVVVAISDFFVANWLYIFGVTGGVIYGIGQAYKRSRALQIAVDRYS